LPHSSPAVSGRIAGSTGGSQATKGRELSIEKIIMGYTQNGAYQLRRENEVGSIETGKIADPVVLSDNLFDVDADQIWKVKPIVVFMVGEVIQGALPGDEDD
jgi:predicted amidohydrolase YtcJ